MNQGFNLKTKQSDEWQTPDWLFKALDSEFGFTLDAAATAENTKCKEYRTVNAVPYWTGHRVFCNPPYSNIEWFVNKALSHDHDMAVLLLPVRTDNDWFRHLIEIKGVEIRYFRKRICFLENGKEQKSPRFASMIAIVR